MFLKGRTCYISGPLEFDHLCEDWRTPLKRVLRDEFGVNYFDPSLDPKQNKAALLRQLKTEGRWKELSKIAHEFVRADLSIVDRADFLIVCLPYRVPVFGTIHELIFSSNAKKPTLLVCSDGKDKIASWAFGFIREEFIFGSWEELYGYLRKVDRGDEKDNDRWYFVYHYYHDGKQWLFR